MTNYNYLKYTMISLESEHKINYFYNNKYYNDYEFRKIINKNIFYFNTLCDNISFFNKNSDQYNYYNYLIKIKKLEIDNILTLLNLNIVSLNNINILYTSYGIESILNFAKSIYDSFMINNNNIYYTIDNSIKKNILIFESICLVSSKINNIYFVYLCIYHFYNNLIDPQNEFHNNYKNITNIINIYNSKFHQFWNKILNQLNNEKIEK